MWYRLAACCYLVALGMAGVWAQDSTIPPVMSLLEEECTLREREDIPEAIESTGLPTEALEWLTELYNVWVQRFEKTENEIPAWDVMVKAAVKTAHTDMVKVKLYKVIYQQLKPILGRLRRSFPTQKPPSDQLSSTQDYAIFEKFGIYGMLFYPRSQLISHFGIAQRRQRQPSPEQRDADFDLYLIKLFAYFANQHYTVFEIYEEEVILASGSLSRLGTVQLAEIIPSPESQFQQITADIDHTIQSGFNFTGYTTTGLEKVIIICQNTANLSLLITQAEIDYKLENYHDLVMAADTTIARMLDYNVNLPTDQPRESEDDGTHVVGDGTVTESVWPWVPIDDINGRGHTTDGALQEEDGFESTPGHQLPTMIPPPMPLAILSDSLATREALCRSLQISGSTWQLNLTGIVPLGLREEIGSIVGSTDWQVKVRQARKQLSITEFLSGLIVSSSGNIIRLEAFVRYLNQTVAFLKHTEELKMRIALARGKTFFPAGQHQLERRIYESFQDVALSTLFLYPAERILQSSTSGRTEPTKFDTVLTDAIGSLVNYFEDQDGNDAPEPTHNLTRPDIDGTVQTVKDKLFDFIEMLNLMDVPSGYSSQFVVGQCDGGTNCSICAKPTFVGLSYSDYIPALDQKIQEYTAFLNGIATKLGYDVNEYIIHLILNGEVHPKPTDWEAGDDNNFTNEGSHPADKAPSIAGICMEVSITTEWKVDIPQTLSISDPLRWLVGNFSDAFSERTSRMRSNRFQIGDVMDAALYHQPLDSIKVLAASELWKSLHYAVGKSMEVVRETKMDASRSNVNLTSHERSDKTVNLSTLGLPASLFFLSDQAIGSLEFRLQDYENRVLDLLLASPNATRPPRGPFERYLYTVFVLMLDDLSTRIQASADIGADSKDLLSATIESLPVGDLLGRAFALVEDRLVETQQGGKTAESSLPYFVTVDCPSPSWFRRNTICSVCFNMEAEHFVEGLRKSIGEIFLELRTMFEDVFMWDGIDDDDQDPTVGGGVEDPDLDGGDEDPTIGGGDEDPTIEGGGEDPDLDGGDEDPTVEGGDEDPTIEGGDEDPTIDGDDEDPTADGGDEDPTSKGGDEDPTIEGGGEDTTIDGGDEDPTVDGGDEDPTIEGGDEDPTIEGGGEDPTIEGGGEDPTIEGGDEDPTVDGGDEDPTIEGGDEDPTIEGGGEDSTASADEELMIIVPTVRAVVSGIFEIPYCGSFHLRGSESLGPNRIYRWKVTEGNDGAVLRPLSTAVDSLNDENSPDIALSGTLFTPGIQYTLSLTIRSGNQRDTVSQIIMRQTDSEATKPSLMLLPIGLNLNNEILAPKMLYLQARVVYFCTESTSTIYSWSALNNDQIAFAKGSNQRIATDSLPADQPITVRVTARWRGDPASQEASASITFTVKQSPLVANIRGGTERTVGIFSTAGLVLDASDSKDPNHPGSQLSYFWSCSKVQSQCSVPLQQRRTNRIEIDQETLQVGTYVYTVSVNKPPRESSTSVTVKVITGSPPVISIAVPFGGLFSPNKIIIISADLENAAQAETVDWEVRKGNVKQQVETSVTSTFLKNGQLASASFKIPKGTLDPGSTYTVTATSLSARASAPFTILAGVTGCAVALMGDYVIFSLITIDVTGCIGSGTLKYKSFVASSYGNSKLHVLSTRAKRQSRLDQDRAVYVSGTNYVDIIVKVCDDQGSCMDAIQRDIPQMTEPTQTALDRLTTEVTDAVNQGDYVGALHKNSLLVQYNDAAAGGARRRRRGASSLWREHLRYLENATVDLPNLGPSEWDSTAIELGVIPIDTPENKDGVMMAVTALVDQYEGADMHTITELIVDRLLTKTEEAIAISNITSKDKKPFVHRDLKHRVKRLIGRSMQRGESRVSRRAQSTIYTSKGHLKAQMESGRLRVDFPTELYMTRFGGKNVILQIEEYSNSTDYNGVDDVRANLIEPIKSIVILDESGIELNVTGLSEPIVITFLSATKKRQVCKYFDPTRQEWRADGVQTARSANWANIECRSSHLTDFATVEEKAPTEDPYKLPNELDNNLGLNFSSYVGLGVAAVIGIVVGVLLLVILAILIVVVVIVKVTKNKKVNPGM